MLQMALKYAYQHFHFKALQNLSRIVIFGSKRNHLATLDSIKCLAPGSVTLHPSHEQKIQVRILWPVLKKNEFRHSYKFELSWVVQLLRHFLHLL
jgi:hypothetical protein